MKVWLYYAEAGGGHLGPAKAMAAAFTKKYGPEASFVWFDLGKEGGFFLKMLLEDGYSHLVHRFPWMYAFVYELSKLRPVMWLENALAGWLLTKKIVRSLQQEEPNVVVATYFILGPLRKALKKLSRSIPLIVVVTEPFSAPPIWFYYTDPIFFVASDEVQKLAREAGVKEEKINLVPQIVHEVTPKEQNENLSQTKTVLLVGGGNGFPKVEKMLKSLLKADLGVRYRIVCGNNSRQKKRIEKIAAKTSQPVMVYGFVDNLQTMIASADVVVTKAGANLVQEVLLQDKPLIIAHYIWGQEKGTMLQVIKKGLGFYEPNPDHLPDKVRACLFGKHTQEALKKARHEAKLSNGASDAVELIAKLLH